MIITLNNLLSPHATPLKDVHPSARFDRLIRATGPDCRLVSHSLPGKASCTHHSMLAYLLECWTSHHGMELTPDMVWFTLACQMAAVVRRTPDAFRDLFTTSDHKENITVSTNVVHDLPLETLSRELRMRVPSDAFDLFTPSFSTTTPAAREACLAAFADAASPYYEYSTKLCGIPRIRVGGMIGDWTHLEDSWSRLCSLLKGGFNDGDAHWAEVSGSLLRHITSMLMRGDDTVDFWSRVFDVERCGSGHETLHGWITFLFRYCSSPKPTLYSIGNQNAMVKYVNMNTGRKFVALYSLFYSTLDSDGFLVPEFGKLVLEHNADLNERDTL